MMRKVEVAFGRMFDETFDFDIPNSCPHCGKTMRPDNIDSYTDGETYEDANICLLLRCTEESCQKFFSLEYGISFYNNSGFGDPSLIKYSYRPPINIVFPENVDKVSSSFVEIYSQAAQASANGLNQIAGVGYRKSAEFLIKDYVVMKNPEKEEEIKNLFLGKVITNYLNDFPKIQSLAKATAWIGNDETHYIRKHDNKDIEDLKKFIQATAQFIAADYDADEAIKFTSQQSL